MKSTASKLDLKESISNSTEFRVEELVRIQLAKTKNNLHPIRMGIEHEFFLLNPNGQPASFIESQNFFSEVSKLTGWKVFQRDENEVITQVSFECATGGYHSLKYEHPPHLVEIAFAPFLNLHDLYEAMQSIWKDLFTGAKNAGLSMHSASQINPPKIDWSEASKISSKYEALSKTRELLVSDKEKKEPWVHFTNYTAATQFHVGGCEWWAKDERVVEKLYRVELFASLNAYHLRGLYDSKMKDAFHARWHGYFKVFQSLSLLGFPKMESWSFRNWIKHLCESTPVVLEGDPLYGKKLIDCGSEMNDDTLSKAISTIRDLQIVRPKLIGTIEFRADAAFSNPEQIIRQAAFRFGLYHYCLASHTEPLAGFELVELSERWRNAANIDGLENEFLELKEKAFTFLRARGLGEEIFL